MREEIERHLNYTKLPTGIIKHIMRYISHPLADEIAKCIEKHRNTCMIKLRGGAVTLHRINQKKELQDIWFRDYERSIIKNTISRHAYNLDVTYAHANYKHILAIKNADKRTEITNQCWHLITTPRLYWREGYNYL